MFHAAFASLSAVNPQAGRTRIKRISLGPRDVTGNGQAATDPDGDGLVEKGALSKKKHTENPVPYRIPK